VKYDKKGEIIAFRDKTVEKAMEAFNTLMRRHGMTKRGRKPARL
jgi:hypothetical protein